MKDVSYGTQNRVPQCVCFISKECRSVQQCNQLIIISVVSTTCAHISRWLPKSLTNNCPQHVSWQKAACKIRHGVQPPAFIKKVPTNEISPTTYFWALRAKCSVSSDWYIQKHWGELPKKEIIQSEMEKKSKKMKNAQSASVINLFTKTVLIS